MGFLELAKERFACRNYSDKKVEKEKLEKILEAGRISPTAANMQPQRLLVIQEDGGLEKLKKGADVYQAPLVIVVCGDKEKVWKRPFDGKDMVDIDTSIVTTHMMLEAKELGLDTVWICYFKPDVIRAEFNIPENLEPVNILAIGYGNGEKADTKRFDKARKPLSEIVFYEKF